MNNCVGCVRENSTDIKDHLEYCQYCKRNDNKEYHKDKYQPKENE